MATKPCIPKGTRDFSPVEMAKRNYIFDTIRNVFYLYGFQQIETPAMESLSTLMGKYGEEGDKLLFKIQNSGDYFSGLTDEELLSRNAPKLACKFCEKGLRYDLTVPFARYVVMHRDEITFPFKRFQIQPVWRADRPQKGRYREFYQCDADVVGSNSLLNEVELVQMIDAVFGRFGIRVCIKVNNRKILTGIAEIIGEADKIVDITVAIDKLDKIGLDNVNAELASKGISEEAIAKLQPIIRLSGSNEEKISVLKSVLAASETGLKGIEESEGEISLSEESESNDNAFTERARNKEKQVSILTPSQNIPMSEDLKIDATGKALEFEDSQNPSYITDAAYHPYAEAIKNSAINEDNFSNLSQEIEKESQPILLEATKKENDLQKEEKESLSEQLAVGLNEKQEKDPILEKGTTLEKERILYRCQI